MTKNKLSNIIIMITEKNKTSFDGVKAHHNVNDKITEFLKRLITF